MTCGIGQDAHGDPARPQLLQPQVRSVDPPLAKVEDAEGIEDEGVDPVGDIKDRRNLPHRAAAGQGGQAGTDQVVVPKDRFGVGQGRWLSGVGCCAAIPKSCGERHAPVLRVPSDGGPVSRGAPR